MYMYIYIHIHIHMYRSVEKGSGETQIDMVQNGVGIHGCMLGALGRISAAIMGLGGETLGRKGGGGGFCAKGGERTKSKCSC
jgi:hypothetical protein